MVQRGRPTACAPRTARIDFDEVERQAETHRPRLIIAGGSAYPRIIDFARFRAIADRVGAYLMVDMAHFAGLVAGGAHPSPLPHAHVVTTTTHKTLRGPRGGMILCNDPEHRQADQFGGVPRAAGRAADARHRRQGGGVRRGVAAGLRGLCAGGRRQRAGAGGDARRGRARDRLGRHRHASDAGRSAAAWADRPRRRAGARARRHHLQQERHPVRPAEADRDLGRSSRLAGGDDARLRRRGIPPGRRVDRRGAARACRTSPAAIRRRSSGCGSAVAALCARFPIYPAMD